MKEYEQQSNLSLSQVALAALGVVGGIWMIVAPAVLNYSSITVLNAATKKQVPADLAAVTANAITVGVVLIVLGLAALLVTNTKIIYRLQMVANLGLIATGVYLMAVPYLFDLLKVAEYMGLDKPNTSDQLTGIVTVLIAGFLFQKQYLAAESSAGSNLKDAVTA